MRRIESKILTALILALSLGFTACDSWMTGDHFFDTIADEVKYANAEQISVYVRYPTTTWGSTSPNGKSTQKVDIPFTVTAVDNNEYGFYKWAAFSTIHYRTSYGRYNVQLVDSEEAFDTEYENELLGEDEVVFSDPYSSSSTVRILNDRNDVFIMPICVKKPVLQDTLPANNQTGVTKNTSIQLVFSNAMNPKYLLVKLNADGDNTTQIEDGDDLTDSTLVTYLNTDYVTVEQIMAGGEHPFYADITTRLRSTDLEGNSISYTTPNVGTRILLPATLNSSKRTLSIRLPGENVYWPNGNILVTVKQDVQDKLGYTMPNDDELVFSAGDDMDSINPKVLGLQVGTTSLSNNAGGNYPRVGKYINVRAYITDQTRTSEMPSEGNVNKIKYFLDSSYNAYPVVPSSGKLPSGADGIAGIGDYIGSTHIYRISEINDETYSPAVNFTDRPGVYPKAVVSSSMGTVFQIEPDDFPSGRREEGGLFKLFVYGQDNVGNEGETNTANLLLSTEESTDKECKYVVFIRDVDPPIAADCAGNISSANAAYAPYGWYGSDGLGHIQLKEASAGAITDKITSSSEPKYYSNKVWCAFYLGSASDAWVTDMQKPENAWDSSKWHELLPTTSTPLSTLLGHDIDTSSITEGNVSVYAIFKDDVGNVSSKAEVNAVKFDGTAPQMGTLSWITSTDVPMGFAGHAKIDNHTLAIPFTESLSGIKKIAIEVVPPGGGAAYKQAFSDADFSIRRKNSATYNTYADCGFTRSPATPAAGAAQNLVLGGSTDVLDYSLKSDTSYTYLNTIYLDNLKIAAEDAALVEGNYTIKVKLYDAALNESAEKSITICVDNVAPVISKLLVKNAKQFAEAASDPEADDTYKYFLPSSTYDSSISGYKSTLEITVQEAGGLREISFGDDAYLTSSSVVTLRNSATNAAITAPYTVDTSENKILFSEKGTAMCATGTFIVTVTNVKIAQPSSSLGSGTIYVSAKDYALMETNTPFSTLSFDDDSNTYNEVWMDHGNISPSTPTSFTVQGMTTGDYPDGYAKDPILAKTTLVLPTFGESGLKKIKLTGAKANYAGPGHTRVYRGTATSGASAISLGYTVEDGGTTIILEYPLVATTPTLTFTKLELTSTTEGSNTVTAKYEYLAGWESSAISTTVIYDTVAPVIEPSSTIPMKWTVASGYSGVAGTTTSNCIENQYLVIPVTETNSGVHKIKIEVEKENEDGDMEATTTASCDSVAYVGYASSGTSTAGGTTLNTSYFSKSGNEITLLDSSSYDSYGKASFYYIKGITISDSTGSSLAEGNYTLNVTFYDRAGNVSDTKTIDIYNDHTKPVVVKSWFDGVENTATTPHRTYTTHTTNNTLFIQATENGSGIQKINLSHPFGDDPYKNEWHYCRAVIPTSSTKLYYKTSAPDATFTEVSYNLSGSSSNYTLVVSGDTIKGTDVILKITGLEIVDSTSVTDCAASVGTILSDLAQNVCDYDFSSTANNPDDNPNLAAIAEDCDSADVRGISIVDSEKVLQGESLVAETGTLSAQSGYTNTPFVNISCVVNEWVDLPRTAQSGLRAIVLEGATFTELTEIKWMELYKPSGANYWEWPGVNDKTVHYHGAELTGTYLGSKTSIAEVPFGFNTTGFYLVGDNTLVLKTPISVGNDGYVKLEYVKLDSTSTDGSKTVKIKVYDVAGTYPKSDGTLDDSINKNAGRPLAHSDWPEEHEASGSITYCGTAPTITVNDTAKSDPATITAANIQTLVPKNNGLQAYAEGTTVWTFSHSSQGNRNGSNSTPSGNGVYLGRSYCPYFDLDITPSTAANLLYYKWTNSETVPTSWDTTNSSYKVNVNFPTSGDVSADSVTAKDWYLHVADYAGNVTTKKMSQCQWINETVASAWPKRNSDGDAGTDIAENSYYLEASGTYGNSTDPKFTVTLPAGTTGTKKIYIPTSWFNKVCGNGAPIYGYAFGTHDRAGSGHTDIDCAKFDENGPYLELPQSFYNTESGYNEMYFYVYDAVGQDLTAVICSFVDSTPPWLEPTIVPETTGYIKWKDNAAYVYRTTSSTEGTDRFFAAHHYTDGSSTGKINVAWNGSLVGASNGSESNLTKGLTADNPLEFYTNSDIRVDLRAKDNDILSYKYSVDGVTHTIADTLGTWDGEFYRQSIPSIAITDTPQTIRIYAVDKGSNTTDLYFKITKDTEGPEITATDVTNVNQITEGGQIINYFGVTATAKVTVTDALVGLATVNGSSVNSYSNIDTNLTSMNWDESDKSLKVSATDKFGNSSNDSSMTYGTGANASDKWVKDVTRPGTPTLSYDASYPYPTTNSISSDYNKYNSNGLTVTSSGSSYTIKYAGGVNTITISPNPNSSDSDVMGYLFRDSTTGLATFYSVADVSQSITIPVTPTSSTITKYIYAVDKAGNPSSSTSYLTVSLQKNDTSPTLSSISGTGLYSSGANGWFKTNATGTGATLTPVVTTNSGTTITPSQGIIGYGHEDGQWTIMNPYSSPITVPADYDGKPSIWLCFYSGEWCEDYFIKAEGGIVSATTSNTVTTWTKDDTPPTNISIGTVVATGETGADYYYNAATDTIYFNSATSTLTLTPTALDTGGSGIKGFAFSDSFASAATTLEISTPSTSSTKTIYAFDNVGNSSSKNLHLVKDSSPPSVSYDETSMNGCTQIGTKLYFKDNTAKLQLGVVDSGSGVDTDADLKNGDWLTLSEYMSDGAIVIPSGKIKDNVGNTDIYTLVSNIVHDDKDPNPPMTITGATATGGNAWLSGNQVFYSGETESITLTITKPTDPNNTDGSSGSGVAGYTIADITGVTATGTTVTIPVSGLADSQSVVIKSRDGVERVSSTGLSVTLIKDIGKPTVEATYTTGSGLFKNTTTGKIYFTGTTPTATLSINDNGGSGIPTTGSLQDGATIGLSAYYHASSHSLLILTNTIYDNVGNTQEYTLDLGNVYKDDTPPTNISIDTVVATGETGAKYHYDAENATIYFNSATSTLTLTPTALDTDGSGIKGFALSNSFASAATTLEISTSSISESGTTKTIYAFDNVGNSAYISLTIKKDESYPSVNASATYAADQDGLYITASRIYFTGTTPTATLSINENGSGLSDGSLTSSSALSISQYYDATSHSLKIPINKIKDNVGNTAAYTIDSGKVYKDETLPNAPTGVTFAANSGATVYNPTDTNTLYYNGSTTEITLTLSGAGDGTDGSGVAGFTASGVTLNPVSGYETSKVTISTEGLSDTTTISIKTKDNVGNVSESGLSVTLIKDAAPPTRGTVSVNPGVISAKIHDPDEHSTEGAENINYTVNVASSSTKLTFPITETGSGLAEYAIFTSTTYDGTPEWQSVGSAYNASTGALELDLPEIPTLNSNVILLLKDNVGNVTPKDATDAYKAACVTVSSDGWWTKEDTSTIAATYSAGAISISGAKMSMKKIEITAEGLSAISSVTLTYVNDDGTVHDYTAPGNFGSNAYTFTKTLISYDSSVRIALTCTAAPTSIKITNGRNEVVTIGSIVSANTFGGFIRHNLPGLETVVGGSGSHRGTFVTERVENLADYFTALSHASLDTERVDQIAFNIGKNMENGGELKKEEKIVTADEIRGYDNEASVAEDLPLTLQNNAWQAPNGTVPEDSEQILPTEHLAQLNPTLEFGSPNKVLTATDAPSAHQMEENRVRTSALVLALLSLCAAGVSAVLFRRRRSS